MAKWYGVIGYGDTVETSPGVWTEQITERYAKGEVIRNAITIQSTDQLNEDIKISNSISIIADPYANSNFHKIRYITYMGTKWKVTNVEVKYPRLILTIGGIYNEN